MRETIPIGSFLVPNEYMVRNANQTFGIILGVKDNLRNSNYRVFLSTGIDKWLTYDTIIDLFEVHRI